MKRKKMVEPPTITQTLQADRTTWLQTPATFHEKGKKKSLRESHTPRKAAVSHRRLFPGLQAESSWLNLYKVLGTGSSCFTPFSNFLKQECF